MYGELSRMALLHLCHLNPCLSILVFAGACFYNNAPLIKLVIWKLLEFLLCLGILEDLRFKYLLPEWAKQSYCSMELVERGFPVHGAGMR